MSISYPLTFPSAKPSRFRWRGRSVVAVSESPYSFAQQVYAWPGQRWEMEWQWPRMGRADAMEIVAFLLKLNGRQGTFLAGDPSAASPRGVGTGTPVVNGASQTGNELVTDGWTASTADILLAGDYIQLGSGTASRLYRVLDDVDSDGSGNATLTIWPSLRSSPADNAAITVNSPVGCFRLTESPPVEMGPPTLHEFSFAAMEALDGS